MPCNVGAASALRSQGGAVSNLPANPDRKLETCATLLRSDSTPQIEEQAGCAAEKQRGGTRIGNRTHRRKCFVEFGGGIALDFDFARAVRGRRRRHCAIGRASGEGERVSISPRNDKGRAQQDQED